jgi:hypothetical protein
MSYGRIGGSGTCRRVICRSAIAEAEGGELVQADIPQQLQARCRVAVSVLFQGKSRHRSA